MKNEKNPEKKKEPAEETEKKPRPEEKAPETIQQLKEQIRELTDLLQRTQANFENYRKQQEKRVEELQSLANKTLIFQLLSVLDNFELALKNTSTSSNFFKGIELIYSQLFTLLEAQGLKPIQTKNQLFNPHLHEALLQVPSEQPENIILEEFQKGFLLHAQLLRPAKVKVSSGSKENSNSKENLSPTFNHSHLDKNNQKN